MLADGFTDQGVNLKRAADPPIPRRTALRDACKARAAPVERGFDEQGADFLNLHRVNQELSAVGDRLHQVRLRDSAVRKSTDRGGWVAPVALHQLPYCPGVRRHGSPRREQAVASPSTGSDRYGRASHERPKRGVGSAPRLEGG